MSRGSGAASALDALSDVARVLSKDGPVSDFLNRYPWEKRFGLSDSLFLVGTDPIGACEAAAEFFFNLAFYNSTVDWAVLMRGALAFGEVQYAAPLFPETAGANLAGEAVVEAVTLEKTGGKGPRLFVSGAVADLIMQNTGSGGISWILDRCSENLCELLWLLPPNPTRINGGMVGQVADAVVRLFKRYGGDSQFSAHYVAYLDFVVRSLLCLREQNLNEVKAVLRQMDLERIELCGKHLMGVPGVPVILERLKSLCE
ncbi:MAG: hypothetical protein HYU64_13650 [Armatimonadetes bacterium]|nr:hypothetical protein [Armatimonadota bacterium]